MSDDKNKVSDKAGEIAKNIWLAGVGAYGKAVEDAQDRLEKAGVEPPKLFKELVKAGTALEKEARGGSVRSPSSSVEERINRVRENFGIHRSGLGEDVSALHRKIDMLDAKLDKLTRALEQSGTLKKATPKKSATRKAPTKKAKATKPAARKASAKSAAKKPVARKTSRTPSRKKSTAGSKKS